MKIIRLRASSCNLNILLKRFLFVINKKGMVKKAKDTRGCPLRYGLSYAQMTSAIPFWRERFFIDERICPIAIFPNHLYCFLHYSRVTALGRSVSEKSVCNCSVITECCFVFGEAHGYIRDNIAFKCLHLPFYELARREPYYHFTSL